MSIARTGRTVKVSISIDKGDLAVEEGEHLGQQVGDALIGGP